MAYDAFISYSHAADQPLARALERGLQRFARPWFKRRAMDIFRDEANLNLSAHLWASIQRALDASRFFLCLASPAAAQSPWVAREIEYWKAHRDRTRLIIVLTEGDLVWDGGRRDFDAQRSTAIPGALHGAFDDEPFYLDMRWARAEPTLSLDHDRFKQQVVQIAATLRDLAVEDMAGEEAEQHRRTVRIRNLAIASLGALAVTATIAAGAALRYAAEAKTQQAIAEASATEARSQRAAAEASAREATRQRDWAMAEALSARARSLDPGSTAALLLATEAVRKARLAGSDRAADAESVLLAAMSRLKGQGLPVYQGPFVRQTNMEHWFRFAADGASVLVGNMLYEQGAVRFDLTSAVPAAHRTWIASATRPTVEELEKQANASPDKRWLVSRRDLTSTELGLIDRAPAASPGRFRSRITSVAWLPDGTLVTAHETGIRCGGCDRESQWRWRWSRGIGLEAHAEPIGERPAGAITSPWGVSLWKALGLYPFWDGQAPEPPTPLVALPPDLVDTATASYTPGGSGPTGSVVSPDSRWGLIRISYRAYPPCGYGQILRLVSTDNPTAPSTSVTVWENGAIVRPAPLDFYAGAEPCATVGFSSDGAWLAAETTLWHLRDMRVGSKAIQLPGEFLTFDPGGRFVVVQRPVKGSTPAGALLFVPLDPDGLIETACRSAGRNLDYAEWAEHFPGEAYRRICPDVPLPWVDANGAP